MFEVADRSITSSEPSDVLFCRVGEDTDVQFGKSLIRGYLSQSLLIGSLQVTGISTAFTRPICAGLLRSGEIRQRPRCGHPGH